MDGDFSGVRMLVVEDEALIGMMLEDHLVELGCRVVGVRRTTEAAAALLDREQVDAVVLEISLDPEGALAFARCAAARGIRIVFTTAEPRAALQVDMGPWPVLTKPFAPAELADALGAALRAPTALMAMEG